MTSPPPPHRATANLDIARTTAHYRQMLRIRLFEETALQALEQGLVHGAIHPSIGQEATAVGVVGNLQRTDLLLSTHRGHGHTLVKGAPAEAMMRELCGKQGGSCGGKGGSMHIADFAVGMLGANGVVGANISIATGAAHALKLTGNGRIVTCIFGDGAINRGPFLEGLNWARVYDLPVLFVCEDNTYAATTRTDTLTAGDGAAARAASLGIVAVTVDGNDVTAVDQSARELIAAVRGGDGPRMLLAKTYRLTGHTGADPATYRSADEVAAHQRQEPLRRCADLLLTAGTTEQELASWRQQAATEMQQALEATRNAPWPDVEAAFADVQDIGAPPAGAPT